MFFAIGSRDNIRETCRESTAVYPAPPREVIEAVASDASTGLTQEVGAIAVRNAEDEDMELMEA